MSNNNILLTIKTAAGNTARWSLWLETVQSNTIFSKDVDYLLTTLQQVITFCSFDALPRRERHRCYSWIDSLRASSITLDELHSYVLELVDSDIDWRLTESIPEDYYAF